MDRRRNPFRGFVDTISEMNRMREHWMTGYEPSSHEEQPRTHATAWVPTTDIFALGDDLIIRCELSGVNREDLDITLSSGTLTISGERHGGPESEELSYYVRERFYGTFRRTMTLPDGIEDEHLEAKFENGLLQVTVRQGALAPETRSIKVDRA